MYMIINRFINFKKCASICIDIMDCDIEFNSITLFCHTVVFACAKKQTEQSTLKIEGCLSKQI